MADDISNKTIVVLVILTVIISILGAAVVWTEVDNARIVMPQKTVSVGKSLTGQGHVKLKILPQTEPGMDTATGEITLTINR